MTPSDFTAKLNNMSMLLNGSGFTLTSTNVTPFYENMMLIITYKDFTVKQYN
jgi:hypothetical protein